MTHIQWTDTTWNPTTGCDRVSPGCDNCYAMTLARRLKGMGSAKYQRDGDPRTSGHGFGLTIHTDTLDDPLRWRKPRKVFVNSMSDLSGGIKNSQGRIVGLFPQVETPVRRSASCATGVVHGRANDAMSLRRRGDAR